MQNKHHNGIHVIDNSTRDMMQYLDIHSDNYFSTSLTLITNFAPYNQKVIFNRPTRTVEHRVILVRQGTTTINVSYNDYVLEKGDIFIIPANSVLTKKKQSEDYNVFCIAFRIPEIEQLGLIDYTESYIKLSYRDLQIAENYFILMSQLLKMKEVNQQCINHIIISFLYNLYKLYRAVSRPIALVNPDRSLQIMNAFTRLLLEQEYPSRKPEYYANRLHITKGHMADVIKAKSGKTTMYWINDRIILLAQALLSSTDEKIELIGKKLHFSDASQFVKFFKKHTGKTPNEYRQELD